MVITAADRVLHHLRHAGVECIFGVPGGGGNLDLIAAAARSGLRFVLTASETAAALAALAQSEISGRPGACLTTLGPGVTSVVNGVACAWLDRAPLLVFTDSQPPVGRGIFEHQYIDHRALLAPITKWSATLSAGNTERVMREAIERAMAEPRGPVHIDCPGEALSSPGTTAASPESARAVEAATPTPSPDRRPRLLDATTLAPFLTVARKPLLLIGLGARQPHDAEAIAALCASRGVPAMVTYKAKGVVPDSAPYFAGVFTNAVLERGLIGGADLLIGVGLDPVELLPRPWTYDQPIVHIGPSVVDDRHVPFAGQLVVGVPSGMELAAGLLARSAWDLAAVRQTAISHQQHVCPPTERLSAHRVVQIAAAARPGVRVTVDAGAHMFPATMLWPVAEPNGMLISNGLSTMGFALPAAIGAALVRRKPVPEQTAAPDPPIFALTGDGGLLMCAGELVTAVRERLHIVIIVFADASLSLIDIKQRHRQLPSSGVALGSIDWCGVATSVGAAAHCAATEGELRIALASALSHRGPTLIEARIDPATYGATLHTIRG